MTTDVGVGYNSGLMRVAVAVIGINCTLFGGCQTRRRASDDRQPYKRRIKEDHSVENVRLRVHLQPGDCHRRVVSYVVVVSSAVFHVRARCWWTKWTLRGSSAAVYVHLVQTSSSQTAGMVYETVMILFKCSS